MTRLGGVVSKSSDRQAAAGKVKGRWGEMLPEAQMQGPCRVWPCSGSQASAVLSL